MPAIPRKSRFSEKKNRWTVIRFAAGTLVLMLLMQSLVYLSSAKNSQKEILGAATSAYSDLSAAGSSLAGKNFADAQLKFADALTSLQSAQNKLDQFKALQFVATQAKSADQILSGASYLAIAGQKLTETLSIFGDLKISSKGVETTNLADRLRQNQGSLKDALTALKQAQSEFNAASDIPESYVETLQKAKDQVAALTGMLENLSNLEDIYLGFFGTGPRVYLMIFQNYDELRATGGFIGTYGVIKIDDGKIQDLKIDSIYDLDGHIYDNIAAPGPFQPYIKKWGIRDANWFADFPTSARKLLQFFESGSQTADGVLSFTPAMFKDLLQITGPIQMKQYGVTLDSDNFQDIVQYKTSVDYDKKKNNPKQMLADFAPVLLDRLTSLDQAKWLELLQVMQDNLLQKQVLLYSKDSKLEQNIMNLKVAGNILSTDQDYLNIINTNLGGTKTDLEIKQASTLQSKILSDGSIIDTLTIERQNTAAGKNLDFMRVLVPLGSTLVSSKGFDQGQFNASTADGYKTDTDLGNWDLGQQSGRVFVRSEADKTEFTGWLEVGPGETRAITLTYVIPYKAGIGVLSDHSTYSLLFQKQAGSQNYDFKAALDTGALKPYWLSSGSNLNLGSVNFSYTTNSDQYWAVVLTK